MERLQTKLETQSKGYIQPDFSQLQRLLETLNADPSKAAMIPLPYWEGLMESVQTALECMSPESANRRGHTQQKLETYSQRIRDFRAVTPSVEDAETLLDEIRSTGRIIPFLDLEDRSVLQNYARDVGDLLYPLTNSYPNVAIAMYNEESPD